MNSARPLTVWFLFVFFLWAVGKDFQLMVTHQQGLDYAIFGFHNQHLLFFAFLSAIFLLDFAGSYFLLHPQPVGFWVCLAAIGVNLIYNGTALSYALSDLDVTREAYALRRERKGLPTREANLDKIFTTEGMKAAFGLASLFALFAAGLLVYNRKYFSPHLPDET